MSCVLLAMRLAVRQLILYAGCLFIVACLRRLLPAFPVGFFPSFASENGLEDIETGLILAAYPLGMSISSQFAPKIVWRLGPRRACMFSLAAIMALFVAMFGFVPDVSTEVGARVALFFSSSFFAGLAAGLPETTCYISFLKRS